jgi:cytochrome c556
MMTVIPARTLLFATVAALPLIAVADSDPREVRHEIMEGVGDAAKPVGEMLKGEAAFDAATLEASLQTFLEASENFGEHFPAGTETGMDTLAAPAIWEDRAGFDAALAKLNDAVETAIAANAQTLDEARPVMGPVFDACKNCHDTYRLEDD